jgi:hypothetical protein
MMPLNRAKVQVNGIISMCIRSFPAGCGRAWERARNARSVHARSWPPRRISVVSRGVGIGCRSERTVA